MTTHYTIVQHSAAGYKGDGEFARGLETRRIQSRQIETVQRHGGLVFDDYTSAEDFAFEEMYRVAGDTAIIPQAPGQFVDYEIDGLKVYCPVVAP